MGKTLILKFLCYSVFFLFRMTYKNHVFLVVCQFWSTGFLHMNNTIDFSHDDVFKTIPWFIKWCTVPLVSAWKLNNWPGLIITYKLRIFSEMQVSQTSTPVCFPMRYMHYKNQLRNYKYEDNCSTEVYDTSNHTDLKYFLEISKVLYFDATCLPWTKIFIK